MVIGLPLALKPDGGSNTPTPCCTRSALSHWLQADFVLLFANHHRNVLLFCLKFQVLKMRAWRNKLMAREVAQPDMALTREKAVSNDLCWVWRDFLVVQQLQGLC